MLDISNIKNQLEKLGYNQADLANKLCVSREIVSQWLKNKKHPRPRHLLKLANLLNLDYNEIIVKKENVNAPVIAFRKKRNHKINNFYEKQATNKGLILEKLVPYLPFNIYCRPPHLDNPVHDYSYIQNVAEKIRMEIPNKENGHLDFYDLIDFFSKMHSVIIPVMWGEKSKHENALHIYLPESKTTWIYLNLDSNVIDFKFWMAHELGHILTPQLKENKAEDFAEDFAGALLYPEKFAKNEYEKLMDEKNIGTNINYLKQIAKEFNISPITVYMEIKKYASFNKRPFINLTKNWEIYRATTVFQSQYKSVSELIFEDGIPSANKYIYEANNEFKTPFFTVLKKYVIENDSEASFLQRLLDISFLDASNLFRELQDASK